MVGDGSDTYNNYLRQDNLMAPVLNISNERDSEPIVQFHSISVMFNDLNFSHLQRA